MGGGRTGGGDASRATDLVLFRCAAIARAGTGVAGAFAGALDADRAPAAGLAVFAVVVNLIWSSLFVWRAVRGTLTAGLMAADLAEVVGLCLLHGQLVSAEALPTGVSWIAVLVGSRVIYGHIGVRPAAGIAGGLAVIGAYVTGQLLAAVPGAGLVQATIYLLQNVCGLVLLALLRRVGRDADAELAEFHLSRTRARVERLRRADEREADRRLHDTVLATLTMVGSGAITTSSQRLRAQARSDLRVVSSLRASGGSSDGLVRLDHLLRDVPARADWAAGVRLHLTDCQVPNEVADTIAWAALAALVNARRHAGVDHASLALTQTAGEVEVTVADTGRGFDQSAVPAHKYGLREGVLGRLAAIGGSAVVDSAPGHGTVVTLRWRPGG
ncbi:sensor histidine kinase [Amycolatopsis sp. NPDC051758]|uniref:sensor histidine kinase n=1 Tax=Amycolatopsis sp. NPDC051758 TaxID=3363935 RepID=UPI0037BA71A7